MKIVLSRKGCDSSFGGISSVILPNKQIIYIPIPGDEDENISYSQIVCNNNGDTLYDYLKQLSPFILYNGKKETITTRTKCHLDPDLFRFAYPRDSMWRGCFGQADASQTVLRKANIQEGDLFLFFGWFKNTHWENDFLQYNKGNGFHMIYGWLQIDQILYTAESNIPKWLNYHPHLISRRVNKKSNCIYVGKNNLSWNTNIQGFGVFDNLNDSLILTKAGLTRSKWNLPFVFKGLSITYHDSKYSWKDDYFQSAYRGQEFVVEENNGVEEWAKNLFKNALVV